MIAKSENLMQRLQSQLRQFFTALMQLKEFKSL